MNTFQAILSHPLTDAVGAALLHFLWQGTLIAGLLALALYLCRGANPNLRYGFCVVAMMLMFLLPTATALQLYFSTPVSGVIDERSANMGHNAGETLMLNQPDLAIIDNPPQSLSPGQTPPERSISRAIEARAYALRHWIFVGWLIGLVFFSIRMAGGLYTLRRLRKKALLISDDLLHTLFVSLTAKMGVRSHVQLCQSASIQQPLLIGWLKPVVLLPASLVAGMPPAQLEAILAHELAHIRRHDYLVLITQSVMETLLFYHPAVWWASHRMRVEREYCCDEIASEVTGKVVYAKALASIEARRMNLALGAGDGRLVDRIRHVVRPQRASPKLRTSWTTLLILMVICSAMLIGCERTDDRPANEIFLEANELARAGEYYEAEQLAEIAAEKGDLCAMELLAEITYPKIGRFSPTRTVWLPAVEWAGQRERKSRHWGNTYIDAIKKEADKGSTHAMVYLSAVYNPAFNDDGSWREYIADDSLQSLQLIEQAVDAGNPEAKWLYSWTFKRSSDSLRSLQLAKEAAKEGEERALWLWMSLVAQDLYENPHPYFNMISEAIEMEAKGVERQFGKALDKLRESAEGGDEIAIEWMSIVDSLQIFERMAALPNTEAPVFPQIRFCPDVKHWRHP